MPEKADNLKSVLNLNEKKEIKKEEEIEESPWETSGQLVAFRQDAATLADDFLKTRNIKVYARGRVPQLQLKDPNAVRSYRKGQDDAKKIDIKRRRITATEEDRVY